jgi:hypothetical protein
MVNLKLLIDAIVDNDIAKVNQIVKETRLDLDSQDEVCSSFDDYRVQQVVMDDVCWNCELQLRWESSQETQML